MIATPAELLAAAGLDRAARITLQAEAETLAQNLRLPLREAAWGGPAGQSLGSGAGTSLDFQDHRPYFPGDDPRHLNWQAYARTGHYIMKLYREEISPRLDLAVDCSASMFVHPGKARRVLELMAFVTACATRAGALLRCHLLSAEVISELPVEQLRGPSWEPPAGSGISPPAWERVPWRPQSLRILISDLLFPSAPASILAPLLHTPGRLILFAPYAGAEVTPDWFSLTELEECENGERRLVQLSPEGTHAYTEAYQRHFSHWDETCRSRGLRLARVGEAGTLRQSLTVEALHTGAVELC